MYRMTLWQYVAVAVLLASSTSAQINVSERLKTMTLKQKIGQTFLVRHINSILYVLTFADFFCAKPFINPNLIPERDRLASYFHQGYGAGSCT
jgi:hypothetical protein